MTWLGTLVGLGAVWLFALAAPHDDTRTFWRVVAIAYTVVAAYFGAVALF